MFILYIAISVIAGMILGSFFAQIILLIFFKKKEKTKVVKEQDSTIEFWYKKEQKKVDVLIIQEKDAMDYINSELIRIEKDPNENRKIALLKVREELEVILQEEEEDRQINEKDELSEEIEIENSAEESQKIQKELDLMRLAYIEAKRSGKANAVPLFAFTLSREDVFDHIENMNMDVEKFPVIIYAKKRTKKYILDSLRCGEWCFGLMYELSDRVTKLSLRMSDEYAEALAEKYTSVRKSLFIKRDNWYDFILDSSVMSKKEVYLILNDCYFYILNKYYIKNENAEYITNADLANADEESLISEINGSKNVVDEMETQAINEYEMARDAHRKKCGCGFKITRRRIIRYSRRTGGNDVTVHESARAYLPSRLKTETKTYAMVYEKNGQVSLTIRVSDRYAEWLAARHPEVRRACFPKNRNWYLVPIDSTFANAQTVYRVINRAKKIIRNNKVGV